MFSHMMIGSNDVERSRKFYDALFAAVGGKPAITDPKGRLIYLHNGAMFLVGRIGRVPVLTLGAGQTFSGATRIRGAVVNQGLIEANTAVNPPSSRLCHAAGPNSRSVGR